MPLGAEPPPADAINGVPTDGLHGSVIVANSITAEKIHVDDLVAFDATIGGFHITETSIYSGVKESIDNDTRGSYLDVEGQIAFGDSSNFVKYYRDQNGEYRLEISAESLTFGSEKKTVEDISDSAEETASRVTLAESIIQQLSNQISMLVTDGNGSSLMTQTENGWTFSVQSLQDAVDSAAEGVNTLLSELGDTNSAVDALQGAVNDLGVLAEYIKIGVHEGEPCIELGESDSAFKLLITNTRILFMEGSMVPAYINNQSLHIKDASIEHELRFGSFVWVNRPNGNLGLIWKDTV